MAEKSTTKVERTTEQGPEKGSPRAPQTPQTPANPQTPGSDTAKRGPGSGTNPSGLGGNEESVSG